MLIKRIHSNLYTQLCTMKRHWKLRSLIDIFFFMPLPPPSSITTMIWCSTLHNIVQLFEYEFNFLSFRSNKNHRKSVFRRWKILILHANKVLPSVVCENKFLLLIFFLLFLLCKSGQSSKKIWVFKISSSSSSS